MNSCMMALGYASIMLCLGTWLRAKIPALRNMLVPASVVAGVLGLIFMNAVPALGVDIGTDFDMFSTITNQLFTVSFISISLTGSNESQGATGKSIAKGAMGLGFTWAFLYALTPLIGMGIIALLGKSVDMDPIYGTLIPFAFCQGPGQSASYGAIFESYGWDNAAMVAMTFAAIGFIVAFLVGVPAAKLGIKRGIAKNCGKIDETTLKGYLTKEEQTQTMNKDTTCNSNIETLAFHFAVIGLCYVLAVGIAKLFSLIPGIIGSSMSGMLFMNGMIAAYIVKAIMKKLKIDYLLDDVLQSKITGWTADYLVVLAFMGVSFQIIGNWLLPILVEGIIITVVTFATCFYFGQRMGGSNDFERTLALYGTATGTVPSGIALVRIVDPEFKTPTAVELGLSNMFMMLNMPVVFILMGYAGGSITAVVCAGLLAAWALVCLVVMKVFKCWGKKTFSWK